MQCEKFMRKWDLTSCLKEDYTCARQCQHLIPWSYQPFLVDLPCFNVAAVDRVAVVVIDGWRGLNPWR